MIQRILNFSIRKDITKKNKKTNHTSLVRSMIMSERIPFVARYHKKKLIAFCLALVIIYTYDLHKPIIRKVLSMRSPLKVIESWFVEEKKVPNTILQQNYAGIDLQQRTIKLLTDLYVNADKKLHFGMGRYYLFSVYKDLKLIETEEETKKFWLASGFYKQRNQKASGVGLVQYLNIFEQGLKHARKQKPELSEQQFAKVFTLKFIEKAPEIIKWESQFNKQRTKQFLKNMPGDNEKKKDAIIELMRDHSQRHMKMLSEEEMEGKIIEMGLKGLNLTDKVLYWELKRTWDIIQAISLGKKIAHPLTTQLQKISLNKQKQMIEGEVNKSEMKLKQIQQTFEKLYQQKIF